MICTGIKVYDPLTNTYSTGYWVKDSYGIGILYGKVKTISNLEEDKE